MLCTHSSLTVNFCFVMKKTTPATTPAIAAVNRTPPMKLPTAAPAQSLAGEIKVFKIEIHIKHMAKTDL